MIDIINFMTTIEKFHSDIQKTIKYDRANNGGHYDGKRACMQICKLFENYNKDVPEVSRQISDYWFNTYILESEDIANEPSELNLDRIRAFYSFMNNDVSEILDVLSFDDWENLRDFVNDSAETIDIDALQNMMSVILDKGAL